MYILAIIISQQARIMLSYADVSTEPEPDLSFSVLHVKELHANIESTVDFTASHVKWRVLVYKEQNKCHKNKFIFQVYLASNNDSEIKVTKQNGPTSNGTRVPVC